MFKSDHFGSVGETSTHAMSERRRHPRVAVEQVVASTCPTCNAPTSAVVLNVSLVGAFALLKVRKSRSSCYSQCRLPGRERFAFCAEELSCGGKLKDKSQELGSSSTTMSRFPISKKQRRRRFCALRSQVASLPEWKACLIWPRTGWIAQGDDFSNVEILLADRSVRISLDDQHITAAHSSYG